MIKRTIYIIGNWKLHKGTTESTTFIQQLFPLIKKTSCWVGLAPSFTSIAAAAQSAKGSSLHIGAQNMCEHIEGAYTGEISAQMLKEAGAQFVLIGHSERRLCFHEDNQRVHHKLKRALAEGFLPVLCIGETEDERKTNKTEAVLTHQMDEALRGLSEDEITQILIAYEPVWAIGTGQTATPQIAQETHHQCRKFLSEKFGEATADKISILYGGSVKPNNIQMLVDQPDIDGALIGGASLQVESFAQIVKHVEERKV